MVAEPLQVRLERLVVFVPGIFLDDGHDGRRIDEAGQVVHVAVGIVPRDPIAQPEDVGDAEICRRYSSIRRG